MPRQLWLLRHGDAEPHGTRPDAQRKLTERGVPQAHNAGIALAALGVEFAAIYTSPRVRAFETARLAAEALSIEPIVHDPLSSGFDRGDADALLAGLAAGERILVVGHEPDFSRVVYDYSGARIDMKKGGVAALRVETGTGELFALLRPRELELIAHQQG